MKSTLKRIAALALTFGLAGAATAGHVHCLCGDGACTAAGHSHADLTWSEWTSTSSLPNAAGNWYLANDVTLSSTYTPPTGVNLCLNGHVVKGNYCDKLVYVSGAVFTLTDCTDTPHYFNKANAGYRSDVWVYSFTTSPSASSICVKGGCITGGYWSGSPTYSPCMNVVDGSTFNFYRGNLVGNCSEQQCGGMAVRGGTTLNMYGGNVEGNYSAWGFCRLEGTANIYGGSFKNNGSADGGLVCAGTTTIYDIEVSGNVSYSGLAGLYAGGTFTMLGGKVFGNRTTGGSGGMAIGTANAIIGGNVCVTGNYCSASRSGYVYSGGTANNLYIPANITVAISTATPLAADSKIGVTTATAPTATAPVAITDANGADCAKYFTSDKGFMAFNDGGTVYLGVRSCFYVSKTGSDSNDGSVEAPLATLSAAYTKLAASVSSGTIALLSDIDAPAGASPALIVTDGKTVKVTSAKADGTLLTNAEGDYTGVYTIHRADNTCSLIYLSNGNLTFEQVVVTGDAKDFTYGGSSSYGQGFLIFAPGSAADDTLTLGVNSIVRDNIDVSNNGAACGGGIVFGTENNAHNPKMYMNANAAIYGCIAPRHGGALTVYDGDLYMSDNATMMYNGIELPSGADAYFGGGAILAYRGNVHMSGNATITKNYVQLNGGDDLNRCHNAMQIDGNTESIGYVQGNVRIFDNYDDGHLVRNGDGTYTVTGTKQANASAKAGAFYVDGALGESAKIGMTVGTYSGGSFIPSGLNSIVAYGTSSYTVSSDDANKFFDDRESYKITKHASNNQLIFGAEVVSTSLTLGTLTTTGLTGTFGQDIGATANDITVFKDGVKMDSGYTVTFDGANFTITFDPALSDKAVIGVTISKNGYKVNAGAVTYAYNHKHCLCGDGACTAAGHSHSDVNWQLWTSTTALPNTAGNWFLLSDVTLTTAYVPPTGVNLCLNGHVVRETTSGQRVINVNNGVTFALTDCNPATAHNFKVGSNGLWAYTTETATTNYEDLAARPAAGAVVAVKGGAITGGYANYGGGVYNSGTLTLWAGNIIGNTSTANGGGVYDGGTLTMNGGLVCGNFMANYSESYGGGIYVLPSALATMNGGTVSYNYSCCGGGGIGNWGSFVFAAGDIIGNYTANMGGGIYTGCDSDYGSTFLMKGGSISGNVALNCGGGISVNWYCDVKLLGGSITSNQSNFAGGVESGWIKSWGFRNPYTLGGDIKITGNTLMDGTTPNNLYIYAGYTVSITNDPALAATATIGVTTETKPTTTSGPVAVTSNRGEDYVRFTSDEGCKVIQDAGVVKLALAFTLTFYNRPTSNDETVDGRSFYNNPTNVTYIYGDTSTQAPNVVKPNAKFLGWSRTATATVPEYTNDQLSTITTTPGDNIILYSVYGVELGVPVFVALDECSTLPDDGREYSFAITNLDSFTALPTNRTVTLAVPTGRGVANCVGFGPEDLDNPWRMTYTEGDYYYHVSQITNGCHAGEILDEGVWEIQLTVDPDATPRYKVESAIYYGKVADLDENSFQIVKADDAVAAAVTVEGSKTKVALGGDKVVKGDGFNTAVMKGKFEIDFSRNFRVVGSFTPPNSSVPDGTCVGFMPYAGSISQSDVHGGGLLGYMSCTKFAKSVVLDFDPYLNGSLYGDPDFKHFSLTETMNNGYPNYDTAQHKNVASCWPTSASQYTILNDTTENKLTFKVTLPNSTVLEYEYANPTNFFKATKAYFFMSGVVRKGPANSYGCGAVGSIAPSLTMYFDSFNYLGQRAGYGSVTNIFVNRQEAFVIYNAWGGQFADGTETNAFFAEDAVTEFPVDPTRNGYDLDGWYQSWTNGALAASAGLLDPIADQTFYAKWISKSSPTPEPGEDPKQGDGTLKFEPVATNADGSAVIGAGALLKGATNVLEKTDLAVPEFTSNGPDGVPYVIIEKEAFAYGNYDQKRVEAGQPSNRITSVTVSTYVTNIQSFAFQDCTALTNVTFTKTRCYETGATNKLVIEDWAFDGSSVETLTFPADTCVELDYGSFANAEKLADIYILGDVKVKSKYPFYGAGRRLYERNADGSCQTNALGKKIRKQVKVHLSAKLASDAAYVASLTNGMSAVRVVLDQEIEGKIETKSFDATQTSVSFTFTVSVDSPWFKVTKDTLYCFWATTPQGAVVGTGNVKKPVTLTGPNENGEYTATFDTSDTPEARYFVLAIGDSW